jgi:hypothetical protein
MVTPISNGSGRVTAPPPLKPEDAFKKVDVANKGYVTEAELASAIVQLSPEGISLSQADAQSLAKEDFTKMDADRDGKVTLGEIKAAAPRHGPDGGPPPGSQPGPPGGPPPGGGAGAPAGAQGAGSASSAQKFDPADTNQDGTVSESERLAYASKQPTAAAPTSAS